MVYHGQIVSTFKSNVTSAVISQIKPAFGCRQQEGFISSHMVTKLVFKGPSKEPQSKLLPLQFGNRCCNHSFLQNNSQPGLFHHQHANFLDSLNPEITYYNLLIVEVRFPGFLIHDGIKCHPWYARHILERLQLPQCCIVFLSPDCFN